jgi:hypothetical protein
MRLFRIAIALSFCAANLHAASIKLFEPGSEKVVQYEKYGKFSGINTSNFKYEVTDWDGLKKAVGEGIYPNQDSVVHNPQYLQYIKEGKLDGAQWDFVNSANPQADFFKWATTNDVPAVKLFYEGLILERAGLYSHAIKAFYAIVIHYPGSICFSDTGSFVWYLGPVAIGKIKEICKEHPELAINLVDAEIEVDGKGDNDTGNDTIVVNPGKFVNWASAGRGKKEINLDKLDIVKRIGSPEHELVRFTNGHWQFRMKGKLFVVKGMGYGVTKVGQGPGEKKYDTWMKMDYDKNGKIDGPYDSWVDSNKNGKKDKDEPVIGDWQLLKDMGCNAIRLYHHTENKEILRDLCKNYGIYVLMGDFLGVYACGSGATWEAGTDYGDPAQRKTMLESVKNMVLDNKDEPYVLMWVLGNENNYGVACNYHKDPERYFKFVNEAAKLIKELDPTRPVALSSGDIGDIKIFAKNCPDVDIYGVNSYRGEKGFGDLWETVMAKSGRPCIVLEYGCPAYHSKGLEAGEKEQAKYILSNWRDIVNNMAGRGEGNALGGVVFEWNDEWWKCGDDVRNGIKYSAEKHDMAKVGAGPFPDGWGYSEWFGITGQGDGKKSPYLRELRKAYFALKEEWNKQ